jgi:3-oxoacyl-[acyl-carrier protein] reductase
MNLFAADCLQGEVALVTGASRGIGLAIADQLARAGALVLGTSTSEGGAQQITHQLSGMRGRGAVLDVRDAAAGDALIDAIIGEHGKLSILVNNAGITRDTLAMRMKDDDWAEVIDTNLSAVFRLSRAVLRGMIKARHGRIINITSVVGASGNAGQVNYAAAKAGVAGMTRALARELGSRNITVNCVAPGFVDTDMTRTLSAEQSKALLEQVPAGRLGTADEIAAAVVFLASPAAAYVSGATLHINGGMYMA